MSGKGELVKWDDAKGYGFIRPEGGGADLFAHVRDFIHSYPRPCLGDAFLYERVLDGKGRERARKIMRQQKSQVRPEGRRKAKPKRRGLFSILFVLMFCGLFAILVDHGLYPKEMLWYYAALSLVSFVGYGADKYKAVNKQFRTPEAQLHLVDLLGGWPGGLVAQQLFRHKISKKSFREVVFGTVILNLGVLFCLREKPGYWPEGSFEEYLPALLSRIDRYLDFLN